MEMEFVLYVLGSGFLYVIYVNLVSLPRLLSGRKLPAAYRWLRHFPFHSIVTRLLSVVGVLKKKRESIRKINEPLRMLARSSENAFNAL